VRERVYKREGELGDTRIHLLLAQAGWLGAVGVEAEVTTHGSRVFVAFAADWSGIIDVLVGPYANFRVFDYM
jgi:hypothetical protein